MQLSAVGVQYEGDHGVSFDQNAHRTGTPLESTRTIANNHERDYLHDTAAVRWAMRHDAHLVAVDPKPCSIAVEHVHGARAGRHLPIAVLHPSCDYHSAVGAHTKACQQKLARCQSM